MLVAYLTSQISIIERTAYLTKQIPTWAFANIRGLFCMWNFVDFYDTRLTMDLQPQVSDVSAVESAESSQKLQHRKEAGGMLQVGWNFYSQWHSF